MPAQYYPLKDLSDERLGPYASLKGKRCEREGSFIAESMRVVLSLLGRELEVFSCLVAAEHLSFFQEHVPVRAETVPVYVVGNDLISSLVGYPFHQGALACARVPPCGGLDEVMTNGGIRRPYFVIALNGVSDPRNVGRIVRNAAGFGAGLLVIDRQTCDPYHRQAVRVSLGGIFSMPLVRSDDLGTALEGLKRTYGTAIVVTSPAHGVHPRTLPLTRDICVVFGGETAGICPRIGALADMIARVPLVEPVDSLNVACASAVFCYEVATARAGGY